MTALENFYSKFRSQLSEEIHVDWTDRRLLCSRPRRSDSWHLRVLMDYLKRNLAPWDHPNTPIMFTDTLLTGILRWEFRNFSLISPYWTVLGPSFRTASGYQRGCFYFTWHFPGIWNRYHLADVQSRNLCTILRQKIPDLGENHGAKHEVSDQGSTLQSTQSYLNCPRMVSRHSLRNYGTATNNTPDKTAGPKLTIGNS